MTQQNLLQQAKQGNVQALNVLLNRVFQLNGITAKAAIKEGCLHLLLESAQVPNQQTLVPAIRGAMINLGVESIDSVKVYARQINQPQPVWTQTISLSHAASQPAAPLSDVAVDQPQAEPDQELANPVAESVESSGFAQLTPIRQIEAIADSNQSFLDRPTESVSPDHGSSAEVRNGQDASESAPAWLGDPASSLNGANSEVTPSMSPAPATPSSDYPVEIAPTSLSEPTNVPLADVTVQAPNDPQIEPSVKTQDAEPRLESPRRRIKVGSAGRTGLLAAMAVLLLGILWLHNRVTSEQRMAREQAAALVANTPRARDAKDLKTLKASEQKLRQAMQLLENTAPASGPTGETQQELEKIRLQLREIQQRLKLEKKAADSLQSAQQLVDQANQRLKTSPRTPEASRQASAQLQEAIDQLKQIPPGTLVSDTAAQKLTAYRSLRTKVTTQLKEESSAAKPKSPGKRTKPAAKR